MNENNNNQLLKQELFQFCRSELLSEGGLYQIIQRQGLMPTNDFGIYDFFFVACRNERVTEEIIQCLLEYFPGAARAVANRRNKRKTPLHCACFNKNVTEGIIQLLIDAAPDSVRSVDGYGRLPLHNLCLNRNVVEATATQILRLLLQTHPESIRHEDESGYLAIHWALQTNANLEAIYLLHEPHPDSLYKATNDGNTPLFCAVKPNIEGLLPTKAVLKVKFLLDCDPNLVLQLSKGRNIIRYIFIHLNNKSPNFEVGIQIIEILFDLHPEALRYYDTLSNAHRFHRRLQEFIRHLCKYSALARDLNHMTTPDANGQLPLHTALQTNVRLGSIKLLVTGNPTAIHSPDNSGALPLHVACQHHDSVSVVKYLVGLDPSTLEAVDRDGNTALHLLCRGARHDIIALILEDFAVSVLKLNNDNKLPIELLWESNGNDLLDRESIEYTETIFRLLGAHPEMLLYISREPAIGISLRGT